MVSRGSCMTEVLSGVQTETSARALRSGPVKSLAQAGRIAIRTWNLALIGYGNVGKEFVRLLKARTAGWFVPGALWRYSNSGYVLLGLIVEKVSGRSFATFLREQVEAVREALARASSPPRLSTSSRRGKPFACCARADSRFTLTGCPTC